jgi:hypothetical protein
METGKMYKSILTITAALALASLGSLAAQAGNGAQGTSKYNGQIGQTNHYQGAYYVSGPSNGYPITEFSSSSAKTTVPHR